MATGVNKLQFQQTMYGTSKHIQEVQKKYENVEKVLIDFGKQYTKLV
jgi:hypothetical protein